MRTSCQIFPRWCAAQGRVVAVLGAITLLAMLGCAQQPAMTGDRSALKPASPWASPTSTMQWNEYACDLIARNQVGQFPAARTLAYLNLAINNAIVAAKRSGSEPDGAAAGAAAAVLASMFPKDEQVINARLNGEVAAIGTNRRAAFASGIEIGRSAAVDVIATAKMDRTDAAWASNVPEGQDKWSSRMQPPRPPIGPRLGEARPFFLTTAAEFRVPAPPAYDSAEFRAQVAEVRMISDARTSEQIRIAQYWENLTGSFGAGAWNAVAREAISAHGLDEATSARVLVLVHLAGFDATLACHDSKYTYWTPRPTQADPKITLAIGVPNHPSYPSNHACISGAIGAVLDAQFPDQSGRYSAMARQAGESRIYGGIHYRMDVEQGTVIAQKVAARALQVGVPTDRPFIPLGK